MCSGGRGKKQWKIHNAHNSRSPPPSPPGTQCGGSPLTTVQLSAAHTHARAHTHCIE